MHPNTFRHAAGALSLALSCAVTAPAYAQRAITADAVAAAAAQTSRDARARDRDLAAAAAGVDQALVAMFPRLSVGASYNRLSDLGPFTLGTLVAAPGQPAGPINAANARFVNVPLSIPSLSNSTQLTASLVVPLSDYLWRLPQQLDAAHDARDAARWQLDAARRRAAFDGRLAYYQWVRAVRQCDVVERTLAQAREHRDDAARMEHAGTLAHVDALRAETQVANAELLAARAASLRDASAERVRTVMHLADGAELAPGDDLAGDVDDPSLPTTLTAMVDAAVASRPELRALAAQRTSLDAQARAARAAYLPSLAAVASVLDANPNPRVFPAHDEFDATWSVGVTLSYSPNDIALGRATSQVLAARAESVTAQADALRDALRTDLATAVSSLRESAVALRTSARALESADEAWRVRREMFRTGRATNAELTDAEADLLRARIERENATVDRRVAVARVAYLMGAPDRAAR